MLLLTDSSLAGYRSNFGSDDNAKSGDYRDGSDGCEVCHLTVILLNSFTVHTFSDSYCPIRLDPVQVQLNSFSHCTEDNNLFGRTNIQKLSLSIA